MTKKELKKEAEEYTKNLLKRLGIKENMLLENQPKYLRHESMNFVALDVENVTDAYLASAEPREKRIAELEAQIEKMKELLEKWYNQYSDKTYTETFYQDLLRATEKYLWTDVEA